ncbi:hypothetical protein TraAM80_05144 [Trypanosoma rangeli]|uniref:Uncharacterized protein n=1 Tax=Trypanosoma rangeli TaxID=5698 RepID=A0A3R7KDU3_TRYRA|nr:uncharacterized protein TraAM80_05144 [Trypanosoma rangeli]RNF04546.1 hypothetical protein TraAM80_05144 [Trypanosoma rangeli]|eukprot:RNF04546.1 hypothetical protein TraAM80_05144 [Trypanosoma rangeli]
MSPKIFRRQTVLTGSQSPQTTTNAGSNATNNSSNVGGVLSSNGGTHQNLTNGGSSGRRAKSRLLPVSQTDSLLKPSILTWKLSGMSSGAHIHRRPPSVQGRTVSPMQTRQTVTKLKKEIIEHRADPSPAPSRPPRRVARHSVAVSPPLNSINQLPAPRVMLEQQCIKSTFHTSNDKRRSSALNRSTRLTKGNTTIPDFGAAPQSSHTPGPLGVGRHNIVLDMKRNTGQVAERRQLLDGPLSTNKVASGDTVRDYNELCVTLGQAPQDAWIAATLEDTNKSKGFSSSACNVGVVEEKKLNARRCDKVVSPIGGLCDYGQRKKLSNNTFSLRRLRSVEEERKVSSGPPSICAPPLPTGKTEDASGVELGKDRVAKDTVSCDMVTCRQQLQPYQQKMKLLKQRRKDVQEALYHFLALCQSQSDPEKKTSNFSPIAALESHANLLTNGLKELQRRNVALLLRLTEYSREVRRPLGSVGGNLDAVVAERHQQHQIEEDEFEKRNEEISLVVNKPATRNLPNPFEQFKETTPTTNSMTVSSMKEPSRAYLSFLREEEGLIVQQLNEVCSRVREALTNELTVTIADKAMLETPLFLPSLPDKCPTCLEKGQQPPSQHVADCGCPSGDQRGPGVGTMMSSAVDSAGHSPGLTRRNTVSPKSSVKKKKNGAVTDNGGRTTPPKCTVSQGVTAYHGPFVGVALMNRISAEDHRKKVEDADGDKNSFLGCNTDNLQLVLGGGRRCFSYAPLQKTAGGNAPISRSKSTSACNVTHKMKTLWKMTSTTKTPPTASTPTTRLTVKPNKSKAPPKSVVASVAMNDILAARIKEAEETWKAIKGLASVETARTPTQVQPKCVGPAQKIDDNADFPQTLVTQEGQPPEVTAFTPTPLNLVELENTIKKHHASLKDELEVAPAGQLTLTASWVSDASCKNELDKNTTRTVSVSCLNSPLRCKQQQMEEVEQPQVLISASASLERPAAFIETVPIEVVMATRIKCCWRQHMARAMVRQRRKQVDYEKRQQQRWHLENVMAFRLQRLFAKNVARRRRRREAMQRQCDATLAPQSDTKMADKWRSDSNKENSERPLTLREKFEKSKERRRKLLHSTLNDTSFVSGLGGTLCGHPGTETRLGKRQQPASEVAVKVPPLDLKSSCISTLDIDKYWLHGENFRVNILHRLLRAPRALLYVLRVMCEACPTRPVSALAFLKGVEDGRLKKEGKNNGNQQTPQTEEDVGKWEKEDKHTFNQPGAYQEDCAKSKKGTSNNPLHRHPHQDMKDENEIRWYVLSYRMLRRRLLARKAAMKNGVDARVICPFSIHVKSLVEEDEMLHEVPVAKGFQRPFECWGTAYAFQARVFSAAAEYAWKLIFSHTPHDDYKQRMLKTKEEKRARLERVEQRNRMILACYCVSSEQEWLKEASNDIGFIARIWNPKRSLDSNDPDFERHCHETYDFVEDFLYQCFPTIADLEEIPTFLMGAGIFFLLKSTLSYAKEKEKVNEEDESLSRDIPGGAANKIHGGSFPPRNVIALCDPKVPLTTEQRETIFAYEVLNLLEYLICFDSSEPPMRVDTAINSNSNRDYEDEEEHDRNTNNNNMDGQGVLSETSEERCERVERPLGAAMRLGECFPFVFASLFSEIDAVLPAIQRPHLRLVRTPLPEALTANQLDKAATDTTNVKGNDNTNMELELVYPRGYLVNLSERVMRALLGSCPNLEVCEDMDATL